MQSNHSNLIKAHQLMTSEETENAISSFINKLPSSEPTGWTQLLFVAVNQKTTISSLIKNKYRQLVLELHPDKNKDASDSYQKAEQLKTVNAAYKHLNQVIDSLKNLNVSPEDVHILSSKLVMESSLNQENTTNYSQNQQSYSHQSSSEKNEKTRKMTLSEDHYVKLRKFFDSVNHTNILPTDPFSIKVTISEEFGRYTAAQRSIAFRNQYNTNKALQKMIKEIGRLAKGCLIVTLHERASLTTWQNIQQAAFSQAYHSDERSELPNHTSTSPAPGSTAYPSYSSSRYSSGNFYQPKSDTATQTTTQPTAEVGQKRKYDSSQPKSSANKESEHLAKKPRL